METYCSQESATLYLLQRSVLAATPAIIASNPSNTSLFSCIRGTHDQPLFYEQESSLADRRRLLPPFLVTQKPSLHVKSHNEKLIWKVTASIGRVFLGNNRNNIYVSSAEKGIFY